MCHLIVTVVFWQRSETKPLPENNLPFTTLKFNRSGCEAITEAKVESTS